MNTTPEVRLKSKWVSRVVLLGVVGFAIYLIVDAMMFMNTVTNWIRYPWSSIQGKTPPKLPPAPALPVPDYPKASFPVLDSGFLAAENENYWWLDNDRVMFKGYEAGTFDPDWGEKSRGERLDAGYDDSFPLKSGFYIWDTRKNTVALYRRDAREFCYEDGEAYFQKLDKDPEAFVYMRGPLGKEQEVSGMKGGDLPDNRWITITPCWVDQRSRVKGATLLRRGWGRLEIDKSTPQLLDMPIFLIPHQGDPVALPMKRKKWGHAIYAPWRDQYLLVDGSGSVSEMPEIWWLSKDGRTESIPIPHTGYATASFYPVKPGVLMLGAYRRGVKRKNEYFLLESNGSAISIETFYFGNHGISPDGCKIAYQGRRCEYLPGGGFANIVAHLQCFTAQMIDFCQKSEPK